MRAPTPGHRRTIANKMARRRAHPRVADGDPIGDPAEGEQSRPPSISSGRSYAAGLLVARSAAPPPCDQTGADARVYLASSNVKP